MKTWDAFISYASEDRELVVDLAQVLRSAGLRIWIDQTQLRLGDSLSEKIDEGLAASRFGIVVVSPSFIGKRWPRQELNGLMAREEGGTKVILPVWHDVDKTVVAAYSPMLADRLASSTENGVYAVADDLVSVIIDLSAESPSLDSPTLERRFLSVLENADLRDVRNFLGAHLNIPARAAGGNPSSKRFGVRLGEVMVDIGLKSESWTEGTVHWTIIQLEEPAHSPFRGGSAPIASVAQRVAELEALREWISQNPKDADVGLPGLTADFAGTVVAGRRSALSAGDVEHVRRYNAELGARYDHATFASMTLRTYDWLVDAALRLTYEQEYGA